MLRSLIGLLLTGLLLGACDSASEADTQKAPTPQPKAAAAAIGQVDRSHAGAPAPAVTMAARDGSQLTLADLRGTPVLVNLWATWCAPCLAEMPALDRLAARAGDRLQVLPVSQDLEGWKAVDRFFTPGKFQVLRPYLDLPNDFAAAVRAPGLPVSILYDAHGREVWRVNGPLEWDEPRVDALLGLQR